MYTYAIAAVAVITTLLYLFVKSKLKYWNNKNVAIAKPIFFFGNLKDHATRRLPPFFIYQDIYNAFPNEKVVGIYRLWSPALLVRDPEILKYIMIKDFNNFVNRGTELPQKGMSANLFFADGDTWKVLRNKLSPVFTSGKLKNMMYLLNRHADSFITHIAPRIEENPEQDMWSLMQKFTTKTISATAFGMDIDMEQLEEKDNIFEKLDKLLFNENFATELDILFPGLMKKLNLSFFPEFLTTFFYGMVDRIFTEREGRATSRKDFMDLLLDMKNAGEVHSNNTHDTTTHTVQITKELMAAQALIFYAAGYETTASTISYLFRLLALHPEVQAKVYDEIERVTKKHGEISYECVQEMSYLGQTIDETLRLFPLIDLQRSLNAEEYVIPGTQVKIERGTMLFVSARGLHYDEQYYPDPEKFDPDRFSPENVSQRHPCVYVPFGVGSRNCIGIRFAKLEARLAAVKLLQKYRLEPSKNTKQHLNRLDFSPERKTLSLAVPNYINIFLRDKNVTM